ncbi:MAG: phosphoribosylanthranilate isomerase [Bryobacteraceae bacterium]|nr:phosphoribosylanthranilate isomerase [Bryobacteraceae bacterium]
MPSRVIKICGLTNSFDAIAAAAAGATALGFNFYPNSKRFLKADDAESVAGSVPAGVLKVGVFVNEPKAEVEALARRLHLDVAQLHGDEQPGDFPQNVPVWKALRIGPDFRPNTLKQYGDVQAFLFDGPAGVEYGGAGVPFLWSMARDAGHRIIVAGGLDASNVGQAIHESGAWGVDACSRLESQPGRKDHARMIQFIEAARAAQGLL